MSPPTPTPPRLRNAENIDGAVPCPLSGPSVLTRVCGGVLASFAGQDTVGVSWEVPSVESKKPTIFFAPVPFGDKRYQTPLSFGTSKGHGTRGRAVAALFRGALPVSSKASSCQGNGVSVVSRGARDTEQDAVVRGGTRFVLRQRFFPALIRSENHRHRPSWRVSPPIALQPAALRPGDGRNTGSVTACVQHATRFPSC